MEHTDEVDTAPDGRVQRAVNHTPDPCFFGKKTLTCGSAMPVAHARSAAIDGSHARIVEAAD